MRALNFLLALSQIVLCFSNLRLLLFNFFECELRITFSDILKFNASVVRKSL